VARREVLGVKSRVSSTVTKRKPNPRPRKYASASERQAAYRARAPEVCFRAEEKTAQTLDRIAADSDVSRADLLLSMTKFALTNHDWSRFGLTHKPLPFGYGTQADETRKENPTMKTTTKRKPTPAQLTARERFAEAARSGAFKKAGAKRKANPAARKWLVVPRTGKTYIVGSFSSEQAAKDYMQTLNAPWNYKVKRASPERAPRKANPIGDLPKLKKRYQTVLLTMADLRDDQKRRKQGLPDEMPGYTDAEIANLIARYQAKAQDLREAIAMYEGTKTNPAKPAASRRGNPVKYRDIAKDVAPGRVQYAVHMPDRPSYHAIAYFTKKADAVDTAQELSDRTGQPVAVTRVQVHFGPM